MPIILKSFKNIKKLSKEFYKELKKENFKKNNLNIGIDNNQFFFKILEETKYFSKKNFQNINFFSLGFYKKKENISLYHDFLIEFKNKFSNSCKFIDCFERYENLENENQIKNIFLENEKTGFDLLVFFINFNGSFLWNDFDAKKEFINLSFDEKKDNYILSAGIKSIFLAKKIICLCVDKRSKDIVFKINKKIIEEDDLLTYLHLHKDVTLFTLKEVINKKEINKLNSNLNNVDINNLLVFDNQINFSDLDLFTNKNNNKLKSEKLVENNTIFISEDDLNNENIVFLDEAKEINDLTQKENFEELNILKNNDCLDNKDINNDNFIEFENEPEHSLNLENGVFSENFFNESYEELKLPNNKADLINYLNLKKETLKKIEEMILDNNQNYEKKEQKIKYLFIYEPLELECSEINFKKELDLSHYNLLKVEMENKFNIYLDFLNFENNLNHISNEGAYIAYDNDLNIKLLAFNSLDMLIYLFRYINKKLFLKFTDRNFFISFFKLFSTEKQEFKLDIIYE